MLEQYNHFIDYHTKLAKVCFDKIHELYKRRSILFAIIERHEEYLRLIGFPFDKFKATENDVKAETFAIDHNAFDENVKYLTLRANINNYIYITFTTLPSLYEALKEHSFLSRMPYRSFRDLYIGLNTEISRRILLGRTYEFPYSVGMLKIVRHKRNFKKKTVDWGESNKLKKENPDRYIVFHLDDEYLAPKFDKSCSRIPNYKYYRFKFTSFINTKERSQLKYYKGVKELEEVFYEPKVGNLEKMIAVTHFEGNNKRYDTNDIQSN